MPADIILIGPVRAGKSTFYDLAKLTIYTQGKLPSESCNEILERVG